MNVPPKCFSNPANERRGWRKGRERETKRFVWLFKRSLLAKESFNQPIISAKLKTNKLTWPPGPCKKAVKPFHYPACNSHFRTQCCPPPTPPCPRGMSLVWSHRSQLASLPKYSVWLPGRWALLLFPHLLNEDQSLICRRELTELFARCFKHWRILNHHDPNKKRAS